jgi:hypothetical protein
MTREQELAEGIAKSASWWKDHGTFVRSSSAERERHHNYKLIYDPVYRSRAKLEDQLNRAAVRNMGLTKETPAPTHCPEYVGGNLTLVGDRICRLGDANDTMPETEHCESIPTTIRTYEARTAEKEFSDHCEAETGMQMSEAEFSKKKKADRLVRTQTAEIAERLKAAGVQSMRDDAFSMFVYWIHTRTVESLPSYRRICLLPYIAAMTRAPKLAALEYFLQGNPFCRFWTFTTGPRCILADIPARLDWGFSKLRELNKTLTRIWGVQIIFRTTEFGTLEGDDAGNRTAESGWGEITRDDQGRALFHPHFHCVVTNLRGYIRPEKWAKMIAYVNSFWSRNGKRVHWDAGKMIQNARECCKYVVKPGDVLKLSLDELRGFYEVTANRRLVRPMGLLAAEIRARKEAGRILRRKRVGSRLMWAETLNHNRLSVETEAEKAERKNLEDAYALTEECERLAMLEPAAKPGGAITEAAQEIGKALLKPGCKNEITAVMARIGPAAGPTPFKEPRVLVMTNRAKLCLQSVTAHPLVVRLWSNTVESWEAGRALGASAISVHTGTLSGEEFQHDLPDFDPPPPLDPICEPFLAFSN